MNVDDLTSGQLKQIASLFGGSAPPALNPTIGKFVIARCQSAGVHAGIVESVDGKSVVLKDSRRLWYWKAKKGVALSGVAQYGLGDGCKVDVINPVLYVTDVCELIPCTEEARSSIYAV